MNIQNMNSCHESRAYPGAGIGLEDSFRHLSAEKLGARMLALCLGNASALATCNGNAAPQADLAGRGVAS